MFNGNGYEAEWPTEAAKRGLPNAPDTPSALTALAKKENAALFEKYGVMPAVYAGGVMSDTIIKNSFEEKYKAVFAEPSFSADNAAGIAYLCCRKSLCTLPK